MFTRYQMYKHKHTQSRTPLHSKTFFLLFYTYKKKEEEEVNIIVIFSKESILIILQVRFIYSLSPNLNLLLRMLNGLCTRSIPLFCTVPERCLLGGYYYF